MATTLDDTSALTPGIESRLPRSLDVRRLRYFVKAAEVSNFRLAAQRLNITQPSLSQQIHELEEELGVKLFDRIARGVRLSPAGTVFLQEAIDLLVNLDRSIERIRRIGRGEIGSFRIAYNEVSAQQHVTAEALQIFREQFPGVNLELLNMSGAEQRDALLEDRIDVGFRHDIDFRGPRELRVLRECTEDLVLQKDNLVLTISKYHPLARKKSVSLDDLSGETLIWANRKGDSQVQQFLLDYFSGLHIDQFKLVETGSDVAALNLVSIGMGIGMFFFPSRRISSEQTVIYRPMPGPPISCKAIMSWRKENTSPQLRQFVKIVDGVLRTEAAAASRDRASPSRHKP